MINEKKLSRCQHRPPKTANFSSHRLRRLLWWWTASFSSALHKACSDLVEHTMLRPAAAITGGGNNWGRIHAGSSRTWMRALNWSTNFRWLFILGILVWPWGFRTRSILAGPGGLMCGRMLAGPEASHLGECRCSSGISQWGDAWRPLILSWFDGVFVSGLWPLMGPGGLMLQRTPTGPRSLIMWSLLARPGDLMTWVGLSGPGGLLDPCPGLGILATGARWYCIASSRRVPQVCLIVPFSSIGNQQVLSSRNLSLSGDLLMSEPTLSSLPTLSMMLNFPDESLGWVGTSHSWSHRSSVYEM